MKGATRADALRWQSWRVSIDIAQVGICMLVCDAERAVLAFEHVMLDIAMLMREIWACRLQGTPCMAG